MAFSDTELEVIFDRTDGRCHLCGKGIVFGNYCLLGRRGAWEVDHSRAVALGGGNHGNNLYPAHIRCNRQKGIRSSRSVRKQNGLSGPLLSSERRSDIRQENAWLGGAAAGLLGLLLTGGLGGAVILGALGAVTGHGLKVEG